MDEKRFCPICKKEMSFIEKCESSSDEIKTAWSCPWETHEEIVVYIVEFK